MESISAYQALIEARERYGNGITDWLDTRVDTEMHITLWDHESW